MCFAQGLQRSDAGEARTCGPSVSSQALNNCAPVRAIEALLYVLNQSAYLICISVDKEAVS